MRDEQHRGAAGDESSQDGCEEVLVAEVHPRRGLVEHQQIGFARQGAGDQHPLLLAAGEGGDTVLAAPGQPDGLDRVGHRGAIGTGGGPQDAAA